MSIAHAISCPRCEDMAAKIEWMEGLLGLNAEADRLSCLHRIGLTSQVARMMLALLGAPGRLMTKEALVESIPLIDRNYETRDPKVVDVYISRARKRLGFDAIETVYGLGCRLTPSGAARLRQALGEGDIN